MRGMSERAAFVIELLSQNPIGKGEGGKNKVERYLLRLSDILSQRWLCQPSSHFSKKYGFAAWLPLENGGAIHLYVWDNRKPSFVSIDIAGSFSINKTAAITYTRQYFGISDVSSIVSRSLNPPPPTWKELAQDVFRQRLTLVAKNCRRPSQTKIVEFLPRLAIELDMIPLCTIRANENAAWTHWETSGCVLFWLDDTLSLDIYTCKRFDAERAESFTKEFFHLNGLTSYDY
jgi:hypothetical protein